MRHLTTLGAPFVMLGCVLTMGCSSAEPPTYNNPSGGSSAGGAVGQSGAGGVVGQSGAGGVVGTSGATGAGGVGPTAGTGGLGTGGDTGTAGTGGGSAGTGGSPPGGPYTVPRGPSLGCNMQNLTDEPGAWSKHELDVPGVDPQFIIDNPPQPNGGGYDYEFRNYFIRLPNGYDPSIAYPLVFGGGGCGSTDGESGQTGGANPLSGAAEDAAIQVGLSYVWSGGACFEDGHANTPDVPYFDAVYAQIIASNCVDLEKVFISGYSSGAWLSYTVSLARGGVVRGMAAGAGGLREERPTPSDVPFAVLGITGLDDGGNPIHETKGGTSCATTEAEGCWGGEIICGYPGAEDCYDTGSAAAIKHIRERNGCVGEEFEQWGAWPECKKYTGCPAAFPVVYCQPEGGHTDGGERFNPGGWDFWTSLPAVP